MNIAWFSPLLPGTSGIAAYSAELLPQLTTRGYRIDTYTEDNARDFVWTERRRPYDLTIYQMGNAACHDYMWAYLFRYPGLVILHDAQLHQARALSLTKRWKPRRDDYLAEFHANHPEAPADLGELVASGLGGSLYQHWPLIRLVVERARLTVVHNRRLMQELQERHPHARFEHVEMGVGDPCRVPGAGCPPPLSETASARPRRSSPELSVRAKVGQVQVPRDGCQVHPPRARCPVPGATVIAAFGGITQEKRIPQLIRAVSALADSHPLLHVMLIGSAAEHYDVLEDARRWGIADRVHLTGYVPDAELPDYLLGADLCACLRWPSNRETSASWLRCLAAGRTTIVTDLAHQGDIPTLDPRGWRILDTAPRDPVGAREPIAVSIDILDEQHSLQLALERLTHDVALRARLGTAARAWWTEHHQLEAMAEAYQRVIDLAIGSTAPAVRLPNHLQADGSDRGREIVANLGVASRLLDVFQN